MDNFIQFQHQKMEILRTLQIIQRYPIFYSHSIQVLKKDLLQIQQILFYSETIPSNNNGDAQ